MQKITISILFLLSVVYAKNDNDKNNIIYPLAGTELETSLKSKIVSSFNYQRSNVQPTAGDMRYVVSKRVFNNSTHLIHNQLC